MSNLQLPNPATAAQRLAALEQVIAGLVVQPPVVTVTPFNGSGTTYTYAVVAKWPPFAAPGTATTTTGAATLSGTAYNTIQWTPAPNLAEGNIPPVYDIYRVTGGATQGKIASNLVAQTPQNNPVPLTFVDAGVAADGSTVPPFNTVALITGLHQDQVQAMVAAGAITQPAGVVSLGSTGALAVTLALPIAGAAGAGGQDGCTLTIIAVTAHAHTVTTPANGLNGADHIATFAAAVGNSITLVALGGVWYVKGSTGITLS